MRNTLEVQSNSIKEIAIANIEKLEELLVISSSAHKEANAVIIDKGYEYTDKVRVLTEVKDRLSEMYTNLYNIKF